LNPDFRNVRAEWQLHHRGLNLVKLHRYYPAAGRRI
jgi:hypothetical protein